MISAWANKHYANIFYFHFETFLKVSFYIIFLLCNEHKYLIRNIINCILTFLVFDPEGEVEIKKLL